MSLDPKKDFKKHQEIHAETLRTESKRAWFKISVIYALADLANRGATAEELNGANRFVELLTGLGEDEVKVHRLPVKSLEFLDKPQTSEPAK